jgi:hypothetical protein
LGGWGAGDREGESRSRKNAVAIIAGLVWRAREGVAEEGVSFVYVRWIIEEYKRK